MYPVTRLVSTFIKAGMSEKIAFEDQSEISFVCRPWDIDMFMEMNNGRVLTLYDLGRFDLALRSGFGATLKKNKWGLVVAGSTIQYRKRVRAFDMVTMRSSISGFDERWVYIVQTMWVKNQPTSSVLLRTGVTAKGKVLLIKELSEELNINPWECKAGGWVQAWIESEQHRPWPPK